MAIERIWDTEVEETEVRGSHLQLVNTTPTPVRIGVPVERRRAARARMVRRRRRSALALGVVMSMVVLVWPGHAFGGVTGSGVSVDGATGALLTPGMVYIVHEGDSVSAIARLVNPGDPALAQRAIVAELGSSFVVPGEHVLIP
jgi:hypothetical protein